MFSVNCAEEYGSRTAGVFIFSPFRTKIPRAIFLLFPAAPIPRRETRFAKTSEHASRIKVPLWWTVLRNMR